MSDLSRLLGDVYRSDTSGAEHDATPPAPNSAAEATLPTWAEEEALDEAFAEWVPGPPEGAPAAERHALEPEPETADHAIPDEWLVSAEATEAYADLAPASEATDHTAEASAAPSRWCRGDDDLLPASARRGRRSLSLRR
ncbi:MAG TPA: hypothetical protein VMN58_12625 [Acidimicrobiales bacterium]|nr:hypothetical protein [Acidimicrobiales bacterium]